MAANPATKEMSMKYIIKSKRKYGDGWITDEFYAPLTFNTKDEAETYIEENGIEPDRWCITPVAEEKP